MKTISTKNNNSINSFRFINSLSKVLNGNENIVTDMGTSFTCTMQSFKTKAKQRLFTSSGIAAMGFGLPGIIGAYFEIKTNYQFVLLEMVGLCLIFKNFKLWLIIKCQLKSLLLIMVAI